ncbi:MAG: fumarate hydratase C-terminal domain-containing protein [Synergistales bacterium]|jgi:fumarate hydratase subunit beta
MLINTPIEDAIIGKLKVYDKLEITGAIFTGRDAALPRLVKLIESGKLAELGINLQGSVIFHTAVSPAGIGPTSSNKLDIESSIPALSKAGVKIHVGKGSLSPSTVEALRVNNSVFAVNPPVTALLTSTIRSRKVVAFPEEGMEAMHLLQVENFPVIVAIAHGESIF